MGCKWSLVQIQSPRPKTPLVPNAYTQRSQRRSICLGVAPEWRRNPFRGRPLRSPGVAPTWLAGLVTPPVHPRRRAPGRRHNGGDARPGNVSCALLCARSGPRACAAPHEEAAVPPPGIRLTTPLLLSPALHTNAAVFQHALGSLQADNDFGGAVNQSLCEIRIAGRPLSCSDGTRLNAIMSERALAAVDADAGELLALLSVPTSDVERLAAGVVAVSSDAGVRFIAARAQVAGKEALVFMLPDEYYTASAVSRPEPLTVMLVGGDGIPAEVRPRLV